MGKRWKKIIAVPNYRCYGIILTKLLLYGNGARDVSDEVYSLAQLPPGVPGNYKQLIQLCLQYPFNLDFSVIGPLVQMVRASEEMKELGVTPGATISQNLADYPFLNYVRAFAPAVEGFDSLNETATPGEVDVDQVTELLSGKSDKDQLWLLLKLADELYDEQTCSSWLPVVRQVCQQTNHPLRYLVLVCYKIDEHSANGTGDVQDQGTKRSQTGAAGGSIGDVVSSSLGYFLGKPWEYMVTEKGMLQVWLLIILHQHIPRQHLTAVASRAVTIVFNLKEVFSFDDPSHYKMIALRDALPYLFDCFSFDVVYDVLTNYERRTTPLPPFQDPASVFNFTDTDEEQDQQQQEQQEQEQHQQQQH